MALWIVVLAIDNKKRIVEADREDQLYELAAQQYVKEHEDIKPGRPMLENTYCLRPTCGWSRRRLREDEDLATAEL